ncbi:MAG TPA: alpha-hydroxy acid oxidase [Kineosporiaceae bacterium]
MTDSTGAPAPRMRRQLPVWKDVAPLLRRRIREKDRVRRRVSRAHSLADLARIARRRTPRSVFEYVSGGADQERSLRRARASFASVEFHPRVLRDVSAADPAATVLGRPSAMPLVLAPTGFTRMMHHEGEIAVARAAERAAVPYCLSSMSTTSLEDLAAAVPGGRRWFQLYMWNDRAGVRELVARAAGTGFEALILTVDTPVSGNRLRDRRNGLSIPPALTARTLVDMGRHPSWWFNLLTTAPLGFATLAPSGGVDDELIDKLFNPALSIEDLRWLRQQWSGKLLVKGIQTVDDARLAADAGADAVVLSNHGGRQLDRSPSPLELLPSVVEAVGSHAEIYLDTGITSGADVVAAVGLGARACLIGRAYLYGLMAGGETGVDRVLELFREDMLRTLQLTGAVSLDDVKGKVSLPPTRHRADPGHRTA